MAEEPYMSPPQEAATIGPEILTHLSRLTDDTGLLEHACGGIPNPSEGYTVDDNARGIIVGCLYHLVTGRHEAAPLADRYLQFLLYCQREDGRFHNDVDYNRQFADDVGSEDAHGRAAWALGYALAFPWRSDVVPALHQLLNGLWPHLERLQYPAAAAYAILGAAAACGKIPRRDIDPSVSPKHSLSQNQSPGPEQWRTLARHLADQLADQFERSWAEGKPWVAPWFTYDDARLAEALLRASQLFPEDQGLRWRTTGLKALERLWNSLWSQEHQCLILPGNRHLLDGGTVEHCKREQGLVRAQYDQQPLDAAALVDACLAAYSTEDTKWLERAHQAFEWFHGRNLGGVSLADRQSGACYDGLTPAGPNLNQGAESTLSYLMARLALTPPSYTQLHHRPSYPNGG